MKALDNLEAAKKAAVQVKSFSQTETHRGIAWSCMVSFQGKKLGVGSNDGGGQGTRIDFSADQQKQIVEALKAAGYTLTLNIDGIVFEEPSSVGGWFEFAVGQIGDVLKTLKALKRRAKTQIVVEKRSEPRFKSYVANDTPENRAILSRQLGDDLARVLNDKILAC